MFTSDFWVDAALYTVFILVLIVIFLAIKLKDKNWKEYFKTRDGQGILKGIVLAPVIIILIAIGLSIFAPKAQAQNSFTDAFKYGTWFNDASVYAGIDYTKSQSPMCRKNDVDNFGTSNMGAIVNLWQSGNKNIRINSKYTHHSCVVGVDNKSYDAIGIEIHWTVWRKNH